jgi:hypothetical protein
MSPRSRTQLLDQLAEHARAIAAANQRARAVELERDTAQADAERMKAERIDALAHGDDDLAGRLDTDRAATQRTVADLADHIAAAKLQAQRAEHDRQQFAAEHLLALLGEHRQTAQAAADAVHEALQALQALQAAHAQWRDAESTTAHLLRLAGHGRERTSAFPTDLSDLIRGLNRAQADVPLPLPAGPLFSRVR